MGDTSYQLKYISPFLTNNKSLSFLPLSTQIVSKCSPISGNITKAIIQFTNVLLKDNIFFAELKHDQNYLTARPRLKYFNCRWEMWDLTQLSITIDCDSNIFQFWYIMTVWWCNVTLIDKYFVDNSSESSVQCLEYCLPQ